MQGIKPLFALTVAAATLWAADSAREEGIAAFEQGRYSVALAKLQEAAKIPSDHTAKTFLALTEAALNDCKSAMPGLLQAEESANPELYRFAGLAAVKCYSSAGDNSNAFSLLDRLERRFPNDADILYTAAKLHMKAFNDATLAMFQRTPASYRVHELSGEIFEIENRFSDAAAEYRKAIALNPSAPDLHYRLGRAILLESHSPDALAQASDAFQAELKLNPEDAACEFQLGQIAQAQTNVADAEMHFKRAVSLSPNFVQGLIELGQLQLKEKRYSQATPLLERAVKLQPNNEAAHYALLTAYRDSGQMEKAKDQKAIVDRLQKPPDGEFTDFLKRLGEKPTEQQ